MASADSCTHCGYDVPPSSGHCPHCGLPSLFPNVTAAAKEQTALTSRYQTAASQANPAAASVLQAFETAVAGGAQAVIARYATEVYSLAVNEQALYASFYQLLNAEARVPSCNDWDEVRTVVDEKLFPYYKNHIRFAALSLNGRGLNHYGDCFFVLKEDMIAHRATVFEENSVVFMQRTQLPVTAKLPPGYRAIWQDRGHLAVAKLAAAIHPGMTVADFPALLLSDGANPEDDQFIEVHIYGTLSIRSIAAVSQRTKGSVVRHKALQQKLAKWGIPLTQH